MRKSGLCFFALMTLAALLGGCSGSSVQLELPSSHPAHPQATESLYRPPPNYFEGRLLGGPPQTGDKMKMQHETTPKPEMGGHSGHDTDGQPVDDHSGSAPEKQSGNSHMEHAQ